MLTFEGTRIKNLGPRTFPSPLGLSCSYGDLIANYVTDEDRVRFEVDMIPARPPRAADLSFEKAGPRAKLFFNPAECRAAVVTCGGLCPGLNDVIRSIYVQLRFQYGINDLLGVRYGYAGLNPANGFEPIQLTMPMLDNAHRDGGTIIGSSRGQQPVEVMADFLRDQRINLFFTVGGDGTQTGAYLLARECERRNMPTAIVGIPKTIDNDIAYVTRTFGLATAIDEARKVLDCAHAEARGVPNGIAIVKLMGRDSGFIAAGATVASQQVNFTLIPEMPFSLKGENGFLATLKKRIERRGHAVIAIAEGAGRNLIECKEPACDASGNVRHGDIGVFLKDSIYDYFHGEGMEVNIKYFDPSYIIRSVPANTTDNLLCDQLGRNAVHAALAGKTEMVVGEWYGMPTHIPMQLVAGQRKQLDPESNLWLSVMMSTGQPASMMG